MIPERSLHSLENCEVVLFDYEGTLATLSPPHEKLILAYERIHALLPQDGSHDLQSSNEIALLHNGIFTTILAAREEHPEEEPDVLGTYLAAYATHGVVPSKDLIRRIYLLEQHAWGEGAIAEDDALVTLATLHDRGYIIGLASNASYPEAVMLQLGVLNMLPYLHGVSLSGLTKVRKPNPQVFTQLVTTLGSTPDRCIMVGDRLREDVAGAKNAGVTGILYIPDDSSQPPEKDVLSIGHLSDLLEFLPGRHP